MRVDQPGSHVRLTWRPADWERPSTIQVRVLPAGGGASIAFHQEHLAGPAERAEMRERWRAVLDRLEARLAG